VATSIYNPISTTLTDVILWRLKASAPVFSLFVLDMGRHGELELWFRNADMRVVE
jgi:hypothetical protein